MSAPDADTVFTGSIPKLYEEYLVPLIFEPYAVDLVKRVASRSPADVLEVAAGTGVVTRKLASTLPESVSIVATDLNQPMLDLASEVGTKRRVEWRQADAMRLPFEDSVFEAVVCQFGVMFFPEKSKAFSEARRVLRSGGAFIFNVWDRIEENEFAHTVSVALESLFPEDPPPLHGSRAPWLSRLRRHCCRSEGRRIHLIPAHHHRRTAQYRSVLAGPRDRILSRDAAAQRNRGARQVTAGRSNRPRSGRHPAAVRLRSCGRQDSSACCPCRALTVASCGCFPDG